MLFRADLGQAEKLEAEAFLRDQNEYVRAQSKLYQYNMFKCQENVAATTEYIVGCHFSALSGVQRPSEMIDAGLSLLDGIDNQVVQSASGRSDSSIVFVCDSSQAPQSSLRQV